jgi:hypothetical protein
MSYGTWATVSLSKRTTTGQQAGKEDGGGEGGKEGGANDGGLLNCMIT